MQDSSGQYQPGDRVFVETETRQTLKAVAVLYGIPFAGLFVGYGLTYAFVGVDSLAGLGAVGLILGHHLPTFGSRMAGPYCRSCHRGPACN